jgi:hypothetical protein
MRFKEFYSTKKQGVAEGEVITPDFSRGRGVENPNITAPKGYDRFEVDGKKIIGIKNGKKTVVSTTSDELLARELVMIYNGGKATTELKPISMLQAFGSKHLAAAENMGIKLAEKPDYWDDFEEYGFAAKNNFNEIKLKKLEKAIGKLKTYRGVDIYGKTTFGDKPRGPQARTIFMPPENMFIVKFDDGTRYVADKTGAMTYIRNWQKINDNTDIKEQGVAEAADNKNPQWLYHATYRPLLKSIKAHGLGGDRAQAKWEDSKPGVVYLALDPNVAESYAESSDVVPEDWLDQIVILKIAASKLDKSRLFVDQNVQDNEGDTLEYHGVIPLSNISLYKKGVAEAKSPQEFMSQITKVDPSILDKKKDSPYYMAGKMLDRHADKIGRDDMDFADFKRHAALLMGSPEDNMKSAKEVKNLDTAARDDILDKVWEYSATQKDADTYYKVSGFKRLR